MNIRKIKVEELDKLINLYKYENFEKIKDGNVLLVGIGEATTTAAKPSGVGR